MKYFKKLSIGIIVVLIIGFFFSYDTNVKTFKIDLHNEDCYLKIHKKEVTIYNNKDQIIDTYILKEKVKEYSIGDIDGDNQYELVVLTEGETISYGKEVIVFSIGDEIKETYKEDFSELKPWKIATGDIDGDGIDEVSVGVYKKTHFHQVMDKRPFIYSYEKHRLQPKWRGSRLSRPFIDYNFCDIDGDGIDEIISIEVLENNEKVINTYKWKGFGFEGFLESRSFKDIENLIIKEGLIYFDIKEENDSYLGLLKVKDNNLEIERVNFSEE